jgi:hypothetical protein
MKRNLIISMLILGVLASSGCSLFRDEEKSFVDASVEASCFLSTIDPEELNEDFSAELNKIYKKYGFPSDDQVAMAQLMEKYQSNTAVQEEIQAKTAECRKVFLEKILSSQGIENGDVVIEELETEEVVDELETEEVVDELETEEVVDGLETEEVVDGLETEEVVDGLETEEVVDGLETEEVVE